MRKFNFKNVTKGTWIRSVLLFSAIVLQFFVFFGNQTDKITGLLSCMLTAVSAIWAWWMNNSFTDKAQEADILLHDESVTEILIESEMGYDE